ncbi:hypothetical protein C2S51_008141 [Perilla frutescens var. frutescens]|nr:hypothetical protein C2S51_008141 [Perilla frutescens var. frutescens]
MDFFLKAKKIRLMSHRDRFVVADDDRMTISQGGDRSSRNAIWAVEFVEGRDAIRLKSCYGTYLTASAMPFIPGVTGKKVVQTWPCQCDAATEWEPSRDGMQVRLRSIYGQFLRPNGGLPPWRNAVAHDVPYRSKSREKMLWGVEVVEKCSDQRGAAAAPRLGRSRSFSSSMDIKKQNERIAKLVLLDDRDEGFYSAKCWWYPKACLPF